MSKIAERVCWLTPEWSIIAEMRIRERKFWILFPTLVLFPPGTEGPFLDLTFAWLVFGITFRKQPCIQTMTERT